MVVGDAAGEGPIDYTETHQVIVNVGYGTGPEVAMRLERNNIICNYQATPEEEGFTASGALRMGVNEMTRFGFGPAEFDKLAQIMADCILRGREVTVLSSMVLTHSWSLEYFSSAGKFMVCSSLRFCVDI